MRNVLGSLRLYDFEQMLADVCYVWMTAGRYMMNVGMNEEKQECYRPKRHKRHLRRKIKARLTI